MSELKAINAYQLTTNTEDSDVYIHNDEFDCGGDLVECYLKSEADKVIANITKGAISMFKESSCCRGLDLESPLGKIANAAFKHWCYVESIQQKCINFERDKESSRQLRRQLMDQVELSQNRILRQAMELRHQKYKRCMAMADKCVDLCNKAKDLYRWAEDENLEYHYNHKIEFFARWHNRWMELAKRFKEAK